MTAFGRPAISPQATLSCTSGTHSLAIHKPDTPHTHTPTHPACCDPYGRPQQFENRNGALQGPARCSGREREPDQAGVRQLARDKPAGMRYQSFKLDDGVSFVHVGSSESGGPDGNPLVTVEMQAIGAYDSLA